TVGVDYYADYRANLNANVGQGNPLYDITGQQVFGGGFANTGSPSIALLMSKDPEGINDIAKFDGEAKVYPNPATDIINIALTLNKISNKVSYEIVDINGKSIAISSKSNIKSDNISFNTSKLSNGTYFVKIATESGKTQLKFTVSK
nr:T9SS type A sorting domain-containing protein [Chitinophagaceae bacterium]